MRSRLVIPSAETSSSPILAPKLRGKLAKEVYRCGKGMLVSGSLIKPIGYAVSSIPAELATGYVYSAVGHVGEAALGYLSGVGFVRYVYRISKPEKLKAVTRLIYNLASLPMTIYSKGATGVFDLIGVSKLEELWFGQPVYIFDDNCLWMEKNYTVGELLKTVGDE